MFRVLMPATCPKTISFINYHTHKGPWGQRSQNYTNMMIIFNKITKYDLIFIALFFFLQKQRQMSLNSYHFSQRSDLMDLSRFLPENTYTQKENNH